MSFRDVENVAGPESRGFERRTDGRWSGSCVDLRHRWKPSSSIGKLVLTLELRFDSLFETLLLQPHFNRLLPDGLLLDRFNNGAILSGQVRF